MLRFFPSKFSNSSFEFLDSLPLSPIYDLLIPLSIILLSIRVWRIQSRQRIGGKEEGFCSDGVRCGLSGSKIEPCEGFLCESCRGQRACSQRNCIEDEEGEEVGDDALKSRKELVKERVLRVVDTEVSKVQSCLGFLCENCGRSASLQRQSHMDSEEEGFDEEEGDGMKLGKEMVKERKLRAFEDLGTKSFFNSVCYGACDPKLQSCKTVLCETCRGKMENGKDDEGEERFDEEDGIKELSKELAKERKLRVLTEIELEKERRAASSAADETMAKILSLQNEKGLIEREFRQYREMAEQKQAYDREVINNLKWIILKLEQESTGSESLVSEGYDC